MKIIHVDLSGSECSIEEFINNFQYINFIESLIMILHKKGKIEGKVPKNVAQNPSKKKNLMLKALERRNMPTITKKPVMMSPIEREK